MPCFLIFRDIWLRRNLNHRIAFLTTLCFSGFLVCGNIKSGKEVIFNAKMKNPTDGVESVIAQSVQEISLNTDQYYFFQPEIFSIHHVVSSLLIVSTSVL